MKRKHKKYSRPRKPFDKTRILGEVEIKKEFGLKNKKEIWKSESAVKVIRSRAKNLISANSDEQKKFFERLKKIGINAGSIAEVLSLEKKDILKRRLQTVVVARKIARTMGQARQLIVHKKILVNGRAINSPSYIVPIEFENKIELKPMKEKTKKDVPEIQETEK